jgi:hypothetical protein
MDACPFGRASAGVLASWGQNSDLRKQIFKTRDCQSIAGFSLFNPKPNERKKHEQK